MKNVDSDRIKDEVTAIFSRELGIKPTQITLKTGYQSEPAWDSLRHLEIIGALEEEFKISISMDDVFRIKTFEDALETVKRYSAKKDIA